MALETNTTLRKEKKYLLKCFDASGNQYPSFTIARLYGIPLWECCVASNEESYEFIKRSRGSTLVELDIRKGDDYREHFLKMTITKEVFSTIGD